jgi:L-asparaginase
MLETRVNMRFSNVAVAATLCAVASAAPTASRIQPRQATTASERLGLTWLGGNSSLPKVLYVSQRKVVQGTNTS